MTRSVDRLKILLIDQGYTCWTACLELNKLLINIYSQFK